MPFELKVPAVGESITEVQIGDWLKNKGEAVKRDEAVVVVESDKATVEVPAPNAGVIVQVLKQKGETAKVGEVIAILDEAAVAARGNAAAEAPPHESPIRDKTRIMPSAQRALAQHGLTANEVEATGPGGRLLKEDVLRKVEHREQQQRSAEAPRAREPLPPTAVMPVPPVAPLPIVSAGGDAGINEEIVPMSPMRRRIAERLVEAQHTAALLTTFNEVDMSAVMALRKTFQETFLQRYGVKLGFMSFFVKACIDALKLIPQVNAEIRGNNIVYKNHYDIGIAVGGGKGLVVPILRNAETMSFAEIEKRITDFGGRAKENKIDLNELKGGTFTISNGGVYGSLLSTPIINPPQSAILGLHAIQDRPVARDGQVVIRPMMYLALTYDHRLIDGREAVTFLKRIKEVVEDPSRMLIEV